MNALLYNQGKARYSRAFFMDDLDQFRQCNLWAKFTEGIARLFAPLL